MEKPGTLSHHRTEEVLEHMDATISAPPPCMEQAIHEAIARGRMTLQEGHDCLDAYEKYFLKAKEEYGE